MLCFVFNTHSPHHHLEKTFGLLAHKIPLYPYMPPQPYPITLLSKSGTSLQEDRSYQFHFITYIFLFKKLK